MLIDTDKASHVGFAGMTVCNINCISYYSSSINVISFEEKVVSKFDCTLRVSLPFVLMALQYLLVI